MTQRGGQAPRGFQDRSAQSPVAGLKIFLGPLAWSTSILPQLLATIELTKRKTVRMLGINLLGKPGA